jgi:hypothetical protein
MIRGCAECRGRSTGASAFTQLRIDCRIFVRWAAKRRATDGHRGFVVDDSEDVTSDRESWSSRRESRLSVGAGGSIDRWWLVAQGGLQSVLLGSRP